VNRHSAYEARDAYVEPMPDYIKYRVAHGCRNIDGVAHVNITTVYQDGHSTEIPVPMELVIS